MGTFYMEGAHNLWTKSANAAELFTKREYFFSILYSMLDAQQR